MTYYIDADNFDFDRFYKDFAGTEVETQEFQEVEDTQTEDTQTEWDSETF